jgi:triosephosphate isomerase
MLIAGNWKMNTDLERAQKLAAGVAERVADPSPARAAVCPPFVSLEAVDRELDGTDVRLGAQDIHTKDDGSYTGEVAAPMLRSVGCHYVIVGHSERREYFGEDDALVNEKAKQARRHDLAPIICVGESEEQREAGEQEKIVTEQVEDALSGIELDAPDQLVLAYEPIWAIGTGESATPEQAQDMHAVIRERLTQRFNESLSRDVHILYGGSMKPHNAEELLSQSDVDGGLIGGASLQADDFAAIVEIGQDLAA